MRNLDLLSGNSPLAIRSVGCVVAVLLSLGGIAEAQISLGPDGSLLSHGKPFRAIGINYFDCFARTLAKEDDHSYEAGFAVLAEKGIPFARFGCCGYWPNDMKLYVDNRKEYFQRLDGVIAAAEKHQVGLIPSLFWYYACVPDLVGEPMDQWGNPRSKTHAFMRKYVREVVERYKNRSVIWAWEFGNEYALGASLPNASEHRAKIVPDRGTARKRTGRDDLTFEMVKIAYASFATEVRKYDPDRLIITGDSFPRINAWNMMHNRSWKHDTTEQQNEMLTLLSPDPMNLISVHAYTDEDFQRLPIALDVSRKLNKPLFVGEFGIPGDSAEVAEKFRLQLKQIVEQPIPLAALWVFDFPHQPDFSVTSKNARSLQLDLISEANKSLRGSGSKR